MMVSRVVRCCVVLLCGMPWASAASQLAELQPGVRVRVRAPGEIAGRLTGVVLSRSADSVTLNRPNAMPVTVAISKLSSIEISRGKSRRRGALTGAAWGTAIGLGLGLTPITDSTCTGGSMVVRGDCRPVSRASFVTTMLIGSVPVSAGIGALIGRERWEGGPVPTHVGILPPSRTRSAGLVLRWVATGPRRED